MNTFEMKAYEAPQTEIVEVEIKSCILEGTTGGEIPDVPGGGMD